MRVRDGSEPGWILTLLLLLGALALKVALAFVRGY
jgi:hypothetical protein